jgi:hypothetical protein
MWWPTHLKSQVLRRQWEKDLKFKSSWTKLTRSYLKNKIYDWQSGVKQ